MQIFLNYTFQTKLVFTKYAQNRFVTISCFSFQFTMDKNQTKINKKKIKLNKKNQRKINK